MDTKSKICHDLKAERSDVAQPLPAVASALPIAFYLACVATVGLNLMFWMKTKGANEEGDGWKWTESSEVRLKGEIVAQQDTLDKEEKRAKDVLSWLEGSRSFQPLIVSIANSMESKGSIVELGLNRDAANPGQVRLNIKFEGVPNSRAQVEEIEGALLSIGYRTYGAQQTRGQGSQSLDYQATLLWQRAYSENLTAKNNQNDE
jgi:hypothetical protein